MLRMPIDDVTFGFRKAKAHILLLELRDYSHLRRSTFKSPHYAAGTLA